MTKWKSFDITRVRNLFRQSLLNETDKNIGHCLEVLRKAVICNPDLTPYSYFMTGGENSHISVSPVVTRQCVDWDYLQQFLAPRRVKGRDLMLNTGPSS